MRRADNWEPLRTPPPVTPAVVANVGALAGVNGFPDQATLANLCNIANGLSVEPGRADKVLQKKGKKKLGGKGIYFNVVQVTFLKGQPSKKQLYKDFVAEKSSTAVCYENTILPLDFEGGHIAVHQQLAPCTLCCSGYRNWANNSNCTIVVAFDAGYDGSGSDGIYLFSSTGSANHI